MDFLPATMSRKRSRCDDDHDEMSLGFGGSFDDSRKRQRNDTLTEDFIGFPSIPTNLNDSNLGFTDQTVKLQPPALVRPPFVRARTLPFRMPSFPTLSVLSASEYKPTSSARSTPESSSSPSSLASVNGFSEIPGVDHDMDTDMDTDMDSEMRAEEEDIVDIRGSVSPISPFRIPQRLSKPRPDIGIQIRPLERNQMTNNRTATPYALSPFSPHSQFATGRIPTPMYPSFPGSSHSLFTPLNGIVASSQPNSSNLFNNSSPIKHLSNVSQTRAMPSPIREDSMDESSTDYTGGQLSRLSVTENMDMDNAITPAQVESSSAVDITETLIDLPRKGRTRSGAMLSPTQRIFTGYMPDCEKCQLNFPGHSMHILPS